jgi:hypothetical protein
MQAGNVNRAPAEVGRREEQRPMSQTQSQLLPLDQWKNCPLVLLRRDEKRPFQDEWQKYPPSFEVAEVHAAKGGNLGIALTNCAQVDVEDSIYALQLRPMIDKHFGTALSWRVRSNSRSSCTLIWIDKPINDLKIYIGEILLLEIRHGFNKQAHIHGTRDGVPLEWTRGFPDHKDDAQLLPLLAHEVLKQIPGSEIRLSSSGGRRGSAKARLKGDPQYITALVSLLPIIVDRQEWIEIGQYIKGAGGSADDFAIMGKAYGSDFEKDMITWDGLGGDHADLQHLEEAVFKHNPIGFTRLRQKIAREEFNDGVAAPPVDGMALAILQRAKGDKQRPPTRSHRGIASGLVAHRKAPAPDPIIPGYIFPGIISEMHAAPGVGKSQICAFAGLMAASGLNAINKSPAANCHVFLLASEDTSFHVWSRIEANVIDHNITPTDKMIFEDHCAEDLKLFKTDAAGAIQTNDIPEGLRALCKFLVQVQQEGGAAAVFLDMGRSTFAGSKNEDKVIEPWLSLLKAAMAEHTMRGGGPLGVMVTMHTNKADSSSGNLANGAAGSIATMGGVRYALGIKRAAKTNTLNVEITKSNYGPTGPLVNYLLKDVEIRGKTAPALEIIAEFDDTPQLEAAAAAVVQWIVDGNKYLTRKLLEEIQPEVSPTYDNLKKLWDELDKQPTIEFKERLNRPSKGWHNIKNAFVPKTS